jgi:cytochrome c551/c552
MLFSELLPIACVWLSPTCYELPPLRLRAMRWLRLALLFAFTHAAALCAEMPRAFLEQHCGKCHDADSKKGGLDLAALAPAHDGDAFGQWVKVHDRIRSGEMPPAKSPRPAAAELSATLSTLAAELTGADMLLIGCGFKHGQHLAFDTKKN